MNYKEFIFTLLSEADYHRDLLINALAGTGFDTFEETDLGFKAYIPSENFKQEEFDDVLASFEGNFSFSYEMNLIPQKNWNEVWESNFDPLQIGPCYIRATFHPPKPEFPYQVVIDPKMAFGTGHHETTSMMIELMLKEDFKGKRVLDMGCGTGILAILASLSGAESVMAIDYDPVCFESTMENIGLNRINNIKALCGSKEAIPEADFDIILANINRNILLDQLPSYKDHLINGGSLFMSGFYEDPDFDIIIKAASELNFVLAEKQKKKNWLALKFKLSA